MEGFLVSWYPILCCVTLIIGWLVHWAYKWANPPSPCKGTLPPGSMGFPIIGETFQFFKASPSIDIPRYYQERRERYGPLFKTSLVGQPVVVSLDPEVNQFIFHQEGRLFQSWYPEAANKIFGRNSVFKYNINIHKFIRNVASKLFGVENLREVLLGELEDAITQGFTTWAAKPSVEVKDGIADMLFDLVAQKMISMEPAKSRELRKNFDTFVQGILCFTINFPGTTFYKCMKGRRNLDKILSDLLKERLRTPEKKHGDLADLLVEELRSKKPIIDEDFARDILAAILFGSFVTISTFLTIGFKFLTDNPKVIDSLKEEHESIVKKREDKNSRFTWEEYKSLTFTTQVMNEINRMGNIAPGIFRKALTDVQLNGYTIPTGWLVMISPMSVHLNPKYFEDPLKFNPWRWSTQDEAKQIAQNMNFMPFGGGMRLCLGADFSKLFISLFFHILVTKYRWIEIKGGQVTRFAEMVIPEGYHIQLVPTS